MPSDGSFRAEVADPPGLAGRWIRRDPVRAVAIVLILVQVAWRAEIATRGWFSQDEFYIAAHAHEGPLTLTYLFTPLINHLMPAGLLIGEGLSRTFGYEGWPYVALLATFQLIVSIAFYRFLRLLLRPGWMLLVPLCLFLFCPLLLDSTSLWVIGLQYLPVVLAMVLALGAQVKFVRTRRRWHLISLAAALLLGLAFVEKALLIVPLVFLFTACLYASGGPLRSAWRALVRYWESWAVLGGLTAAYLAVYFWLAQKATVPTPKSVLEVPSFLGDLTGTTLVPGLFGGPWRWWYAGDGPPLTDPYEIPMWLSWAALIAIVVVTTARHRAAGRAWTLLVLYYAVVAGLLAATRLGSVLSPLAGLQPRYVVDVVALTAIVVGVVFAGLKDYPPPPRFTMMMPGSAAVALAVAIAVVLGVGTVWSTARFRDNWDVKRGQTYLSNSQKELAKAPPGTVFFDDIVPNEVIEGYWYPYNLQSKFFLPAEHQPYFVTEAEKPSILDDEGHIRPATVTGVEIPRGPVEGCGHLVGNSTPTRIPLDHPVIEWDWVVYFGYVSSGNATASLRLGGTTREFPVRQGLNQIFLAVHGGGDAVEVSVADPAVVLCTNKITVGKVTPQTAS
ncbi:MAG: hypothetical protein HOV79_09880 [Hamadaea sp.]|nr:hypothetical protein [Hamadaea sp.]